MIKERGILMFLNLWHLFYPLVRGSSPERTTLNIGRMLQQWVRLKMDSMYESILVAFIEAETVRLLDTIKQMCGFVALNQISRLVLPISS